MSPARTAPLPRESSRVDLNHRPPHYQCDTLTGLSYSTKFDGEKWIGCFLALYHWANSPLRLLLRAVANEGIEPPTSRLWVEVTRVPRYHQSFKCFKTGARLRYCAFLLYVSGFPKVFHVTVFFLLINFLLSLWNDLSRQSDQTALINILRTSLVFLFHQVSVLNTSLNASAIARRLTATLFSLAPIGNLST